MAAVVVKPIGTVLETSDLKRVAGLDANFENSPSPSTYLSPDSAVSPQMASMNRANGFTFSNGMDHLGLHEGVESKTSDFKLGDACIDDDRPMKVVVIGTGFSGITAGIRFPQRIKNLNLTIYEKNAGVGGTWYSNKYPNDWSAFYAPGSEIRAYLERIIEKYKLMRYIKLQHELIHAQYDELSGKWLLKLRRPVPGSTPADEQFEIIEDTADFVHTGVGGLSRWQWPDIEGLNKFQGKIIHSADWELDFILVCIEKTEMTENPIDDFSEADRRRFKDPVFYKELRHALESELNALYQSVHFSTVKGSEMQKAARQAFKENMIKRLKKKPWIADHLLPDFPVACRRLTPGPGYLEALCENNVDFVPTNIKNVTETGIELVDGTHHELDVIVCATGYNAFQYPFSVIGRGGKTLNERYSPHPETYLTVCTDGFPNWFMALGPNSGVGSGSLLVLIERQVDYAVAAAKKMQREHLKSIEVKKEAVADFDEYLEHYFQRSVFSEKCRSWYKMGKEEGRVVGLWPGSCLHAAKTLQNPRWEDFNFEQLGDRKNRFFWLGDGSTYNEKHMVGDRAWYLDPNELDIPPVPL
ncbi:hypothetical protein EW145_g3232 [Phellinidium pouzarii]|uniref:FAD/NAD(P)-binding domain-containing protein n=1 Tax=Phellinidium pouzarii TaxID=167371 RepID=A0A4S4L7T8_9AGAM|nr:hypothetical protein EW145_g3232 [Phellinidium pouzarii]